MTIYQEELKRRLREQGYGAVYDEQTEMLKIYQNSIFLCDQDKNGDLHFTRDAYTLQNFHEISTPIAKDALTVKDCVALYEKGEPMKVAAVNAFLDSELEQLLCFDTEIDAEKFCSQKSAIFIIMPEENPNTFFM